MVGKVIEKRKEGSTSGDGVLTFIGSCGLGCPRRKRDGGGVEMHARWIIAQMYGVPQSFISVIWWAIRVINKHASSL